MSIAMLWLHRRIHIRLRSPKHHSEQFSFKLAFVKGLGGGKMFSFKDLINEKGKPLVMGILNVTPDSFSDGNEAYTKDDALNKLNIIYNEGADIVDVGACSTAPGNEIVSVEEEIKRLKVFLPHIVEQSPVPVSIDTFRPQVAEYALSLGVCVINDESGMFQPQMAELVKKYQCGWIFMHTGNNSSSSVSEYEVGVVDSVISFFSEMRRQATDFGINPNSLCYDFGIGFGKTRDDDLTLLASVGELSEFSPLLAGVSRKRIIGELTGESDPKNRIKGSVTVAKLLAQDGADILRVHDVKETVYAVK